MTTSKDRSTGRVRRALIITAATIGVGIGLVPGTAQAAAKIHWPVLSTQQGPCQTGYKQVVMSGRVYMPIADAQRFLDNPGSEVDLRLMGDDWRDNVEVGPVVPENFGLLTSNPLDLNQGLTYSWSKCVSHAVLNEDPAPGDGDELYVRATFRDIRTGKTSTENSPNVNGSF